MYLQKSAFGYTYSRTARGASPLISAACRARIRGDPLAHRSDGLWAYFRDLAARFARGLPLNLLALQSEGTGKTGCALHPRSRVQKNRTRRTRAYRSSGEHPAFPAQWLYGLCRALPGEPNSFATVACRIASASLAPASGARTTRFCRTLQRRSSRAHPRPPHPAPRP